LLGARGEGRLERRSRPIGNMRGSEMPDTMPDRRADAMPQEGTPFRRIRMDDDLWQRLEEAAKRADPDSNRSVILRRFARWYVGDTEEFPQRPEPKRDGGN
jgi:hypothetical protein